MVARPGQRWGAEAGGEGKWRKECLSSTRRKINGEGEGDDDGGGEGERGNDEYIEVKIIKVRFFFFKLGGNKPGSIWGVAR